MISSVLFMFSADSYSSDKNDRNQDYLSLINSSFSKTESEKVRLSSQRRLVNVFLRNGLKNQEISRFVRNGIISGLLSHDEINRVGSYFSNNIKDLINNKILIEKGILGSILDSFDNKISNKIIMGIQDQANQYNEVARNIIVELGLNPIILYSKNIEELNEDTIIKEIQFMRRDILKGRKLNKDVVFALAEIYARDYVNNNHNQYNARENWEETPWIKETSSFFEDFNGSHNVVIEGFKHLEKTIGDLDSVAYYGLFPVYGDNE